MESLRKEDEEWQKKAHAAVLSIQDLTVKFFETTTRSQKGKHTQEASFSLQKTMCGVVFVVTFEPFIKVCLLHKRALRDHVRIKHSGSVLISNLWHTKVINIHSTLTRDTF